MLGRTVHQIVKKNKYRHSTRERIYTLWSLSHTKEFIVIRKQEKRNHLKVCILFI